MVADFLQHVVISPNLLPVISRYEMYNCGLNFDFKKKSICHHSDNQAPRSQISVSSGLRRVETSADLSHVARCHRSQAEKRKEPCAVMGERFNRTLADFATCDTRRTGRDGRAPEHVSQVGRPVQTVVVTDVRGCAALCSLSPRGESRRNSASL